MSADDVTFSSNVLNNPYIGFTAPKLTLVQTNNPFPGLDFDHSILVACDSNSTIKNCLSSSSTNYTVSSNSEVTFAVYAEIKQGNFKERSWFSKNVEEPVTKFIATNFFGFQPSDYLQLTGGWIVPMSESGTQFGVSETNADVMFFSATSFFAVFKLAKVSNAVIAGSELKTPIDLTGTGEYRNVKGHHVHAKAAFKDSMQYDPNKGFSISQEFIKKWY